jgi:hypothetical protein
MKIKQKLNYFGRDCEVVDLNTTHVLVRFASGSQLCTPRSTFEKDYNNN